ncbi:MAG: hypothetical protein KGD73_10515 [Candidatus Lokiarchaeota archaeon]|nr:hypothetical protein [Candidatus Lokiarchaeota archaeon]
MVAKLFKKRQEEIMKKFEGQKVLGAFGSANYFGLESKGVKQVRGNGVLVLTEEKLYFEMWVKPKTILEIPIKSIKEIDTVKSHLHKSKFRPLLKVFFINGLGERDSVAWMVNNLKEWIDALQKIVIKQNRS